MQNTPEHERKSPELAPPTQLANNLTWNFNVNLLDISFITLGLSLVSRETVMPVLVSSLTDSRIAIGLIAAIWSLGYYLPQLLTANFTERLRYKKPFVMWVGGLAERVPYLLAAIAIWALAGSRPILTLAIFFFLIGMTSFGAGIATPAWFDMIAKVIPVQRRGIWSGLGHSLGALMGIVGAVFVARILDAYPFPNNFAVLFLLASVAVAISWIGLALNREPPSPTLKERTRLSTYLARLPGILRNNPNYSRFLIGRTIIQLGAMASGFFIVYGRERFAIDGAGIGLLTGVLVGSQALMNLIWGVLGDRLGHKIVLTAAAFGMAIAALIAWSAASFAWLVGTFILLGAYLAADAVSALNIILEFCAPEDRPTYIGLTNTLLAPGLILAPLLGGWLATILGFRNMCVIAISLSVLGGWLLLLWVRDPRGHVIIRSTE